MSDKVPLSLQRQCFFYVVHHLEEFPTEILGLLPLRIREELLLTLAPVDIFQLEGSKATEGVDMKSVWEAMKKQFGPLGPFNIFSYPDMPVKWDSCIRSDPGEYFHFAAGFLLFHRSPDTLYLCHAPRSNLVVSSPSQCAQRSDFFHVRTPARPAPRYLAWAPQRYVRFCSGPDAQATMRETALFLLHHCQINVRWQLCSIRDFHFHLESVSHNLMRDLFRNLEEVCFCNWTSSPTAPTMRQAADHGSAVFSSVLRAALIHSSAGLHTLILSNLPYPFAGGLLRIAANLFSQAHGYPGLQYLLISLSLHNNLPVDGWVVLEQLRIVLDMFQTSLQELYLKECWNGWNRYMYDREHQGLCRSLCSLIRMPQLTKLSIYDNALTVEFVHQLLSNFLQSPCQELHMGRNTLLDTAITASMPTLGRIEMAEDAWKFKSLDLHAESIEIAESLAYLLQGVRRIRLKSLKIRSHIIAECIARHSDVVIEEMEVLCDLPDEQTAKKVLQLLALNTHLKKLVLRCVTVVPDEVLPELSIALFQQATLGSLQELTLIGFALKFAPMWALEQFFNSLFSLPQICEMKVTVRPDSPHEEWYDTSMYLMESSLRNHGIHRPLNEVAITLPGEVRIGRVLQWMET